LKKPFFKLLVIDLFDVIDAIDSYYVQLHQYDTYTSIKSIVS